MMPSFEHAPDDLRHAALLLAKQQKDHGVEEERYRGREQHGALFANASLDDGAEQELLHQRADDGERDARRQKCDDEGQPELTVDVVGDKAPQDVHLTVREVEHVHEGEDQGQPKRDQRILGAQI